jgi:hypothetical protein
MSMQTTWITLDVATAEESEAVCVLAPLDTVQDQLVAGGLLVRFYAVRPKQLPPYKPPFRFRAEDGRLVAVAPAHVVCLMPGPEIDAVEDGGDDAKR